MSSAVPDGWNEPRVRDLFTLNTKSVVPNDFPQEKFTYFSLPAYDEFGTSIEVYGSEIESNKFEINETSVLVSKLNPRKPRVMYAKPEELRACASTEFMSFIPIESNRASLKYFTHYFFSELFQKRLELVATGSTNSHVRVSPKETTNWRVAVPPLPEQKKIASILTSVDEVIENIQKQIDKLQDLKKATMNELLTKGIGHTEFKDSELGRIPVSWEVLALGEIGTFKNGINKPKEAFGTGAKFVNISDAYPVDLECSSLGRLEATEKELLDYRLEVDDIIFVRSSVKLSGVAIPTIFKGYGELVIFCGFMIRFRSKLSRVVPEYLREYLLTDKPRILLQRVATGGANININQDALGAFKILLPTKNEQKYIVRKTNAANIQIQNMTMKLNKFQSLKKSLMQDLLTGKVRVTVN